MSFQGSTAFKQPSPLVVCRKRQSYGHAMIVDPWGEIIAKLDDPHATGIAIAQVDMKRLQEKRTKMPVWEHRTVAQKFCGVEG